MASDQVRVAPSPRTLIKNHLGALLDNRGVTHTIGLGIPANWTIDSTTHVHVAGDGVPDIEKGWGRVAPTSERGPVRITVWAQGTSLAEDLANLSKGMLLVERPPPGMSSILPGTGVITTRDPDSGAELAFFTVRCTTVLQPI